MLTLSYFFSIKLISAEDDLDNLALLQAGERTWQLVKEALLCALSSFTTSSIMAGIFFNLYYTYCLDCVSFPLSI